MRTVPPLTVTDLERRELHRRRRLVGGGRVAQRAHLVLLAADGMPNRQIAKIVGLNQSHVGMWRKRYAAFGVAGLADWPRSGRPRTQPADR